MRLAPFVLALLTYPMVCCSSADLIPFVLLTDTVEGSVYNAESGAPISDALVCVEFVGEQTSLIGGLGIDVIGFTSDLMWMSVDTTDESGRYGVWGAIPHLSLFAWYGGWTRMVVDAEGFVPLVLVSALGTNRPSSGPDGAPYIQMSPAGDPPGTVERLSLQPQGLDFARQSEYVASIRDRCRDRSRGD